MQRFGRAEAEAGRESQRLRVLMSVEETVAITSRPGVDVGETSPRAEVEAFSVGGRFSRDQGKGIEIAD